MNAAAIRVLLLEDNPDDAALVKRTLAHAGSRAFVVTHATTLATALDALRADAFEAVLADLCLLDSSSTNTVKTLVAEAPGTPVIVLTGSDSEDEEEEAMQAGAQDYLVKSESSGLLVARAIRHAVERQQLAAALQRSNLELLVANRELEAFGYTVSHDLRAPLRAIDGFSAILDEDYRDSLPAEALGHLDHLRGAAKRMNEMLTALMALSRIGSAEMLRGPVDMGLLVRECLAELAPEIGAARTDIRTGELPGCSANRPLLKQALLNLIDHGMALQEAVEAPRIWTEGPVLEVEHGIPAPVRQDLEARGHTLKIMPTVAGGMNAIQFHDDGTMTGAACWRADGTAAALGGGLARAGVRFELPR